VPGASLQSESDGITLTHLAPERRDQLRSEIHRLNRLTFLVADRTSIVLRGTDVTIQRFNDSRRVNVSGVVGRD
jgi:hypothetical protein